ncbi:MAG: hypothetical protein ABWZ82_11015 [Candidatus Limnocylindrales bacterium]
MDPASAIGPPVDPTRSVASLRAERDAVSSFGAALVALFVVGAGVA